MEPLDRQILISQLPFLRRYARAVTGNQKRADTLVLVLLEALSHGVIARGERVSRTMLYHYFSKTLNGPTGRHLDTMPSASGCESGVEQKLASLPSLPRQAFLLGAVEGFKDDAIMQILEVEAAELQRLKGKARSMIMKQVATDVLIIEDEMFIATDLENIVTSLGHRVIAIERTHADAVRAIEIQKPGIIIADIQLADGSSGIEAVNEILLGYEVPVIFVTAYPERLLTGLRPEPTFIMTKPYKAESVKAVISQALFFETRAKVAGAVGKYSESDATVGTGLVI